MQSASPFHTLHGIEETAESRKMQPLMKPSNCWPLGPLLFGLRKEEKRVAKIAIASRRRIQSQCRITCSNVYIAKCEPRALAAAAFFRWVGAFQPRTLHTLSSWTERNRWKVLEVVGRSEEGQKWRKRREAAGPDLPVYAFLSSICLEAAPRAPCPQSCGAGLHC